MATSGGIPGGDKGEVHTEPPQPMDLAHGHGHTVPHSIHSNHAHIVRTAVPGSVVQLRPIRTFTTGPSGTLVGAKGGTVGVTAITGGQQSVFVNRTGPNITIVPARARAPGGQIGVGTIGTATTGPNTNISTLQFTRGILSNVRPAVAGQGQSGSITVTPISASNFGTSIRLAAGTPANNGTWIHAPGGPTTFTPLRPTTIQLTNRGMHPDKIIHIPQQAGSLQPLTAITQLQGSILKPMGSATPIIVRSAVHHPNTAGGITNTLPQYGIRATTIHRPATSVVATTASTSQGQKVITQPAHGPPIIVNANANPKLPPHSIQTISSVQRLPMFTISTNGKSTTLTPASPLITMGPRQSGGGNIIMGSALTSGPTSGAPMLKTFSRDVNSSIVESIINQGHVHTSQHQINSPTLTMSVSGSNNPNTLVTSHGSHVLHAGSVITSTSANSLLHGSSGIQTQNYGIRAVTIPHQQQHQLVVHGPINVNTSTAAVLPVQSMSTNLGPYYIEPKTMNVSILSSQGSVGGAQVRPMALDTKRATINLVPSSGSEVKGSLVTGSMILTNSAQAFPIGTNSFAHPIPMAHQQSTLVSQGQTQLQHAQHLIATSQPQVSSITLTKSSGNLIPQTHTLNLNSSTGQPMTLGGHIITVTPHISIPTQVMSTHPSAVTMSASTTTTSLSSFITTSGATGPTTNLVTVSVNNATGSSTGTVTSTTPSSTAAGTRAGSSSTTTSTPAQSPSQSTKATLSPRPSILRKREAAAIANASGNAGVGSDIYSVPFRAQRNLAINFTGNSSSTTLSGLPTIGVSISGPGTSISSGTPSVTISTVVSTAANKENSLSAITVAPLTMTSIGQLGGGAQITPVLGLGSGGGGSSSGMSLLKKEFQPPNEESSWQSCSSNSSSGSTTLSTTSETAEIQLQQQNSNDLGSLGLHGLNNSLSALTSLPSMSIHSTSSAPTSLSLSGIGIGRGQSNLTVNSLNQHNLGPPMITLGSTHNGMFRMVRANPPNQQTTNTNSSSPMGPSIRHRTTSVNKAGTDLVRGKGRGKDVVSPRKKPRKQQLTISDFIESASPEISFYQGKGKRFKPSEPFDPASSGKPDKVPEGLLALPEPQPQRVTYHLTKPQVSLMASNKAALTKVRANHFIRYDDVTTKDEKRPTINDLANQKGVLEKITGWKLLHLSHQMSEVIDSEMNIVETFNILLCDMDARTGQGSSNRDLSRIEDLLKGNIQRCRVIRDQLTESRNQVIKVLEHQPRIVDVINKYISKRPIKKRERL